MACPSVRPRILLGLLAQSVAVSLVGSSCLRCEPCRLEVVGAVVDVMVISVQHRECGLGVDLPSFSSYSPEGSGVRTLPQAEERTHTTTS